jgi:ferredoxin-thioredoxin reductase catalytic subunit
VFGFAAEQATMTVIDAFIAFAAASFGQTNCPRRLSRNPLNSAHTAVMPCDSSRPSRSALGLFGT